MQDAQVRIVPLGQTVFRSRVVWPEELQAKILQSTHARSGRIVVLDPAHAVQLEGGENRIVDRRLSNIMRAAPTHHNDMAEGREPCAGLSPVQG